MTIRTFAAIELFMAFMLGFILYASTTTYYGSQRQRIIFPLLILNNMLSLIADALFHSLNAGSVFINRLLDLFIIIPFYSIEFLFFEYIASALPTETKFIRTCRKWVTVLCLFATLAWIIISYVFNDNVPPVIYYVGQLPGWIIILLTVVTIIRYRHELGGHTWRYLLIYLAVPAVGMLMRDFHFIGNAQHLGISISLLILHLFVHRRQSESLKEQAILLEQNRNHIVLSQIKPHFIYNSLNTIYYLCEKDPSLAQKAIIEFSDYLRGNLDTIGSDVPVPFERELEHIHHYLYLEKLRFEEELNVVYDIQNIDFTVPALSVQLAVENAVKHGIGRKPGGGTITIASTADETDNIVTVTDDGVGFDTAVLNTPSSGKTHIGIQNMIYRIETISSGKVDIKSAPGEGTCITIRIPKQF
ncbi:MAG: histidine kinase [Solobacterium sp.]|nr:histidine kinase [Solobacterium sp.]